VIMLRKTIQDPYSGNWKSSVAVVGREFDIQQFTLWATYKSGSDFAV